MLTILSLIASHLVAVGAGWLGHRKYGSRAEADAKAVANAASGLEATAKKL